MAEIEGLTALRMKMASVSSNLQKKSARSALKKAANVIVKQARINARKFDDPASKEQISKNVASAFGRKSSSPSGDVKVRVGVLGGARTYAATKDNVRSGKAGKAYKVGGDKGNKGGDTWYWRFIEFGRKGQSAQPFLATAAAQKQQAAVEVFGTAVMSGIDANLAKGLK